MAASMQAQAMQNVMTKADHSPVTQADQALEVLITQRLAQLAPGIPVIGEEAVANHGYPDLQEVERFFLVDPIDGTRAYIKGRGDYTVNIALIERGSPVFGVIYAPSLDELFFGGPDRGSIQCHDGQDSTLHVAPVDPDKALRIIVSRFYAQNQDFTALMRAGQAHEVTALSSSLKFCRVAQGLADFYPRLGPTGEWDSAAAQAILEGAGGAVLHAKTHDKLVYGRYQRDGQGCLNPDFIAIGDHAILNLLVK